MLVFFITDHTQTGHCFISTDQKLGSSQNAFELAYLKFSRVRREA